MNTPPVAPNHARGSLGPWTLDIARQQLLREAEVVAIEPKAFDLLVALARQGDRLATKAWLLDTLWPGVSVSENSLSRAVTQLRKVLGDDARSPCYVETVPTRGYRLLVPVHWEEGSATADEGVPPRGRALDVPPDGSGKATFALARRRRFRMRVVPTLWAVACVALLAGVLARLEMPPSEPDASERMAAAGTELELSNLGSSAAATAAGALDPRRVAVLPLESATAEDRWLADGLTEELISLLARIDGLRVVPRTTVASYSRGGKRASVIGKELGAGSLVEGSVQRDGETLRIGVRLVDARRDEIVWARQLDRPADDLFETQTEVALRVAESLRLSLSPAQVRRLARNPTENFSAFEHYLQGRELYRQQTRVGNESAIGQFELALEQDRGFAPALAGLANAYAMRAIRYGFDGSWGDRAEETARRALALDADLPEAHKALGLVHDLRYRLDDALAAYERALEIDPSYEEAIYNAATVAYELGAVDRAVRLQWRDRERSVGRGTLAIYLYELGLDAVAAPIADDVLREDPLTGYLGRYLAARDLREGREAQARERLQRLQGAYPAWSRLWLLGGDLELAAGRREEAWRAYRRAASVVETQDADLLLRLALVDRANGEDQAFRDGLGAAEREARAALANGGQWHAHHYHRAAAAALRGEVKAALDHFDAAVDRGRLSAPWDRNDPLLAPLRSEPRFLDALGRMDERAAEQRGVIESWLLEASVYGVLQGGAVTGRETAGGAVIEGSTMPR